MILPTTFDDSLSDHLLVATLRYSSLQSDLSTKIPRLRAMLRTLQRKSEVAKWLGGDLKAKKAEDRLHHSVANYSVL